MRRLLFPVLAAALAGCQGDGLPTNLEADGPRAQIMDGTSTDPNANEDVFFLPPLVPDPSGSPNFDAGEFNADLRPRYEICELAGDPSLDPSVTCIAGDPVRVFAGDDITVSPTDEHYHAVWHTDESGLSESLFYRIRVFVGDTEIAFADLDVVDSGKGLKNVNTGEFIGLKDGRSLPIKVRIENGALCDENVVVCTEKAVTLQQGGLVAVELPDDQTGDPVTVGVEIPAQPAPDPGDPPVEVTVIVQPCVSELGDPEDLPVDIPLFGGCVDITTDPELVDPLVELATVVVCVEATSLVGLKPGQEDRILVHRQDGNVVSALPNATDFCAELEANDHAHAETGLLAVVERGWHHLRETLFSAVAPLPLEARRRLDRGRGGLTPAFSRFQLGLPSKMAAVAGTTGQTAPIGTPVVNDPAVLVTDASDVPVEGATVSFAVTAGGGAIEMMSATTGADGVATSGQWTLGGAPGANEVEAAGRGIGTDATFTPDASPNNDPTEEDAVELGTGTVAFDAIGVHPYTAVAAPGTTWSDSRDAAALMTLGTCSGHLATLTSQAENDLVAGLFPQAIDGGYWLGGIQPAGSVEPGGGWQWITGEPWVFTNWATGEPNDLGGENALHFFPPFFGPQGAPGTWNDQNENAAGGLGGYVVEFSCSP